MRNSAIQLNAKFGKALENLKHTEVLICRAKRAGAELVLLPELLSFAMGFEKRMLGVASMGVFTHKWMVKVASEYDIILGDAWNDYNTSGKQYDEKVARPLYGRTCENQYEKTDSNRHNRITDCNHNI